MKYYVILALFWCSVLLPADIFAQVVKGNSGLVNVNAEILLNKIKNDGGGKPSREIYILIDENEFSLEVIRDIFNHNRNLYPEPYELRISVYSDRAMLERLINFEKQPMTIEFSKDEEGQAAARKFYEKYYPLPEGYFRASYSRYADFEFFDYSPRKNRPQMKRVTLKSQFQRLLAMKPEIAIFEAAKSGDSLALEKILDRNIDPNIKDQEGFTPLLRASSEGQTEIIGLLVRKGSDLNIGNNDGVGAIHLACFYEMFDSVNALLELGAKVNSVSIGGVTPLMVASNVGNGEIISLLLKSGADINRQTKFGLTALMGARDVKNVVTILLKAGAKTEITDNDGWTAVSHSVSRAEYEKLETLLKFGSKTNMKDKDGNTLLMLADRIQDSVQKDRIVKLLKQYGAK